VSTLGNGSARRRTSCVGLKIFLGGYYPKLPGGSASSSTQFRVRFRKWGGHADPPYNEHSDTKAGDPGSTVSA